MNNSNISIENYSCYVALPQIRSQEDLLKQLIEAIQRDDAKLIRLWTKRGASVNAPDDLGNTPLHIAVILGHLDSVQTLLELGASPSKRNNEQKLAIQIAQENNSHALVEELDKAWKGTPKLYVSDVDLNKQEFSLLSRIMSVAPEEDPISTEVLSIKAAIRTRKRNQNLQELLKRLKQPWELCTCESKDWEKLASSLANPQSACYSPLRSLSQDIQKLVNTLNISQKNGGICASLQKIHLIYQSFVKTCSDAFPEERARLLQGRICLRGVTIGCRYLSLEATVNIFSAEKNNDRGSHKVNSFHGIHWKLQPYAPGVEKAVLELAKLICQQGSPPTILLNFGVGKESLPVLASHTIEGESLDEVMSKHPEWLKKLDPAHFSMMIFLGFLIDPYDGKPDNFIVTTKRDMLGSVERLLISSIDNDLSFSDVFVRSDSRKLLILDILYVLFTFSQMREPVNPAFRDQFLRLSPEEIIIQWLKSMIKHNETYRDLLRAKIFSKEEFRKLQLPFALRPHSATEEGGVENIYRKLRLLKKAMVENAQTTHQELFHVIHPLVAPIYEQRMQRYHDGTSKNDWSISQGYMNHIHNATNIEDLLSDTEATPFNRANFSSYQRPQKAGNKTDSRTLSPEKAVENFLPLIPWKRFSIEEQHHTLNLISTLPELRELTFCHLEALHDEFLTLKLTGFPNLEALTLVDCPNVTGSGLYGLMSKKPHLKLTLGSCCGLKDEDYDLLSQNLSIQFPSGICCTLKEGNTELLHQALREKDNEMILLALRFGIRPDSTALLIVAQLDHQDTAQLKQWMTALFLCKAEANEAVWNALQGKQDMLNHLRSLTKNHMSVYMRALKSEEPWLNRLPDWSKYWPKYSEKK